MFPQDLFNDLIAGKMPALSKAITLIEGTRQDQLQVANMLIERCLAHQVDSIRIGITGVPGVGKSSFIESFGTLLTDQGHRVAVLAVDPTSTESKGSIMGDKTRMTKLVNNSNVFVRPSPSGTSLGGVARKTRESIVLCEAAKYNIILVETVGVGQSETAVHGMVDFFLLLKISGAGDELQGIKRGIVEMADAIAINKADGDNRKNAEAAAEEFRTALHMYPPKVNGWTPPVLLCSALEGHGMKEINRTIFDYLEKQKTSGYFTTKRKQQNIKWFRESLEELTRLHFFQNPEMLTKIKNLEQQVIAESISPFHAAEQVIGMFENKT